jgi:hypothetical protein
MPDWTKTFRSQFLRILLTAAAMSCSVLLAGCVSVAPDPTKVEVPSGYGVLVVRVLANNPFTPLNFSNAALVLQQAQTDKEYLLSSKATAGDSEGLFFGSLPPGRYRLARLVTGKGNARYSAPLNAQTKEFDLTAGRLTDIGALVMTFDSVGQRSGNYHISIIANEADTNFVLKRIPATVLGTLPDPHPLRQDIAIDSADNQRAVAHAKSTSAVTVQSASADGKTVIFGRTLGLVSLWNSETDQWDSFDTGASFNVRSVNILPDGSQLIGCEQGALFLRAGGITKSVASPGAGAIIFVGQSAKGEYLALVRKNRSATLFGSESLSSPNWHALKKIPYGAVSTVASGMTNNRLTIVVGEMSLAATATVYDIDLDSHETVSYPAGFTWLTPPKFEVSPDGTLVSVAGIPLNRKLLRSTDNGKSWTSTPLADWVSNVLVRDAQTIYAQRADYGGMFVGVKETSVLLKSSDAGQSWVEMGELPRFSMNIHFLPRAGWLMVNDIAGNTHFSIDDGKTWRSFHMPLANAGQAGEHAVTMDDLKNLLPH